MELEDLDENAKFIFFSFSQAAIRMRDLNQTQERYLDFALDVWETIDMNGIDKMHEMIQQGMLKMLNDIRNKSFDSQAEKMLRDAKIIE